MTDIIISPGDTLGAIAAANNTTVAALLAANPDIENPDVIFAGASLTIPDSTVGDGEDPTITTDPVDGLVNTGEPGSAAPPPPPTSNAVVEVGGQDIPAGGTLVRIRNPEGSDAPNIFVLRYSVYGVDFSFEVGDRARVNDVFGGLEAFDSVETMSQRRFDKSDVISAGSVDEILGSTSSLESQVELGVRAAGAEGVAPWLRESPEAMTLVWLGEEDGWSQARLYNELAPTAAFKNRFGNLNAIANRTGTDDTFTNVTEFLQTEATIRRELLRVRGPRADVSQEYLSGLVRRGWQPTEVTEILELERGLVENPDALVNINDLLQEQGINAQLNADDFISFMQEGRRSDRRNFTPSELFRTVNDALRLSSLESAGITGIGDQQALGFGQGDAGAGIVDPTTFRDDATQLAGILASNFNELDTEKLGLSRDEVLGFFLDGPGGDPRAGQLIERFARDRGIAARGFDTPQSFIDAQGRLRVQGFADTTN